MLFSNNSSKRTQTRNGREGGARVRLWSEGRRVRMPPEACSTCRRHRPGPAAALTGRTAVSKVLCLQRCVHVMQHVAAVVVVRLLYGYRGSLVCCTQPRNPVPYGRTRRLGCAERLTSIARRLRVHPGGSSNRALWRRETRRRRAAVRPAEPDAGPPCYSHAKKKSTY